MKWVKLWFERRSVILTWLLSYLGILMIPIVISVAVTHESKKTLESEIHRANDALLEEVKEIVDNQIDNVLRLTNELMWNPGIRAFMYSNYYETNDYMYDLYMTTKELGLYQNWYPFIKNYYVYWKKGDVVLLPGVYRDSKLAYSTIHDGENLSYEKWMELLKSRNEEHFVTIPKIGSQGSTLAYFQSFKGDTTAQIPGSIVILLDTEKLLEVIRKVQNFNGGEVMILDEKNQLLLSSSGTDADPNLQSQRFAGAAGTFYGDFRGKQSEVLYIKSNQKNITLVTVVPSKQYWEKARYVNNLTFMALFISLTGGVVLTIYLIRKNYYPVRRILHVLNRHTKWSSEMDGNEFSYIHAAVSNALSEKEQIQFKMRQQTNVLRSNMLSRLLKGRTAHLPLEDSLTAFNVDFKSDRFVVILFYIQEYEAFFEYVQGNDSLHKLKLMHFIMINIVEELVNERHMGVMAEVDDCMACLVNIDLLDEKLKIEELRNLAEKARQFLWMNFKIDSMVSISGVKSSEIGIAEAYKEALDAMEYKFVVGERGNIAFDDLQKDVEELRLLSYYFPIQLEQQLSNHVRAGDHDKANSIITEIIGKNIGHPRVSVGLVKCLMFNIIGTLINVFNDIGDVQESVVIHTSKKIDELLACESVKEMEKRIKGILQEICYFTAVKQKQLSQSARGTVLQERSKEIVAYIDGHYSDPNLNITMIGEHFGMTQTYLSRLFKEQTGNGILDTINLARMERAKLLLPEKKYSIKEIAGRVGFHDVNTFIRTFKKYEGITPGQYQKIV